MPIVGTATLSVMRRPRSAGTPSSTIAKRPGLLERLCVPEHAPRGVFALALDAETAHGVHRLRRQADVAHHRDSGGDDARDGVGDRFRRLRASPPRTLPP